MYIIWYFPLTYYDFVIFIIFYYKLSWNFYFLTNIWSVHLWYFQTKLFLLQTKKSITFDFHHQQQKKKPSSCYQTNQPVKMEHYQGSIYWGEGDPDSDLNFLDSGKLWKYTTVIIQCERFPWVWMWRLLCFDHWSHFDKLPGSV